MFILFFLYLVALVYVLFRIWSNNNEVQSVVIFLSFTIPFALGLLNSIPLSVVTIQSNKLTFKSMFSKKISEVPLSEIIDITFSNRTYERFRNISRLSINLNTKYRSHSYTTMDLNICLNKGNLFELLNALHHLDVDIFIEDFLTNETVKFENSRMYNQSRI